MIVKMKIMTENLELNSLKTNKCKQKSIIIKKNKNQF